MANLIRWFFVAAALSPICLFVSCGAPTTSTSTSTPTPTPTPTPTSTLVLSGNLNFGTVQIGTNIRRTFSINTGRDVSGTIAEGWTLAVTGNSANVVSIDAPGGTITPPNNGATINVIFTPATTAQYSGTFVVTQLRTGATSAVPWSGQGTQAAVERAVLSTDAVLDFGTVPAGTRVTKQLTVRNTGSAPLTVDRVQTSIDCSTTGSYPTNVAPGSSGVITYNCTIPAGTVTGTSTITSNASNSVVTIQLTGRGQ